MLLSEILCLPLELKVSGSDSETNFYQPIVDLFPPTTHLSCDMHMKDSVQKKLSYVNFDITEIDEVMCYVFGKRHRYYFSLTQILLKDLKRWLMKFKKTDEVSREKV